MKSNTFSSRPLLAGLTLAAILFSSCSKTETPAATTSTSAVGQVFSALKESAPEFSTGQAIFLNEESNLSTYRTALATPWANTSTNFTGVSSAQNTLTGYITNLFDANYDQSIFNRAKMPFLISCTFELLAAKTGDLYTTGSQTMTLSRSGIGICGTEAEYGNAIGATVVASFANLTDTTNYDQVVTMSGADNPTFGGADQWMYVRNNSTTLNFMHIEANSDRTSITVSTITYNKSSQSGSFQYASKNTNQNNLYRIFMDQANNDARLYAYKTANSGAADVALNVASTFSNQTQAALSIRYSGQTDYGTLNDGAACVTTATTTLATDNSLTCSGNSKTALAVSGASAIETAVGSLNGSTIASSADAHTYGSVLPTFTADTILSAALGL